MRKKHLVNCLICNKPFLTQHKTKYCSWNCIKRSPQIIEHWKKNGERLGKSNEGRMAWNRGLPRTQEVKDAVSKANKGRLINEKNPNWKGNNVSYIALHTWVKRHYGKPIRCEKCGKMEHITWANKTGQYKRDRDDWMTLCQSCHKKYDIETKQIKRLIHGRNTNQRHWCVRYLQ
jgi:hypothetical protein